MKSFTPHLCALTLLACVLMLLGCAHTSCPSQADIELTSETIQGFDSFECGSDRETDEELAASSRAVRGTQLSLPDPVDYVRLLWVANQHSSDVFAERGAACQGASDASACEAKLAALDAEARSGFPACARGDCRPVIHALTTHGDEVRAYRGSAAITKLLGPIDTPQEAWIMLMSHLGVSENQCGSVDDSAYRRVATGFELARRKMTSSCRPIQRVETVYRVNTAGEVTRLRQTVVERDVQGCFHP